jgi:hypothetical protein
LWLQTSRRAHAPNEFFQQASCLNDDIVIQIDESHSSNKKRCELGPMIIAGEMNPSAKDVHLWLRLAAQTFWRLLSRLELIVKK